MRCVAALLLLGIGVANAADIYRHTDKHGNQVFTDSPPDGTDAKLINLGPINTVPGGPVAPRSPATQEQLPLRYTSLQLHGVEPGVTLTNVSGEVFISASSEPALQQGDSFWFLHNGQAIESGSQNVFHVPDNRGEHAITAQIRDENGRVLITSSPLTYYRHIPIAK